MAPQLTIQQQPSKRGRWSETERLLFLHGLSMFGVGRWDEIGNVLTTRSVPQIKTYGLKVVTRIQAGEDVFAELRSARGNDIVQRNLSSEHLAARVLCELKQSLTSSVSDSGTSPVGKNNNAVSSSSSIGDDPQALMNCYTSLQSHYHHHRHDSGAPPTANAISTKS